MKETMRFCQSCGMPLQTPEECGTEADGHPSGKYCVYCYRDGRFVQELSMEQMIDHCAQFADQFRHDDGSPFTREEAVAMMREFFPHLERWRK